MSELRTLLERFANGKSMYLIFDPAHILIGDASKDEKLRAWFKDLNSYVRKVYCPPSSPATSPHINSLHAITTYKQVTSSNQTATHAATTSATLAADSMTGNTNPTSTTSSSLSGTGSKLWARTPRINDSGRIGHG